MVSRLAPTATVALALAFLALACGKDQPAAPASQDAAAAGEVTSSPAPTSPSEPGPAAEGPTDPARAPQAVPEPAPAPAKDRAPSAPAAASPSGPMRPISLPRFDPEITVVVGTPGLEALIGAFVKAADDLGDVPLPPDPLAAAREAVRMRLGLQSAEWIGGDRPVKLAIPNPKTWPEGFIAVLPVRGGEAAVRKGLGAELKPAEGHAGVVTAEGRSVWLDFSGDNLIITSHADLLARLKPFVEGPLAAWTPPQPLVLEASVENINRIFAKELAASRDMAGALSKQVSKRAAVPAQAAMVRAAIDGVFNFVDDTKRLGFALDPSGGEVRLSLGLQGVAGGDLARSAAELKARALELVDLLPATAWLAAAANMPSEFTAEDRATIRTYLTTPRPDGLTLDAAEADKLVAAIAQIATLSQGDSAFAMAADGGFPFAVTSVSAMSDGHKAREALLSIAELFFNKALAQARAELAAQPGAPADLPAQDLASVLAFVNQRLAEGGLSVAVRDETRDGGTRVQAVALSIDWDKSELKAEEPERFEAIKAMVGPELAVAVASSQARLALTFGPHAVDQAARLAAGQTLGGEPLLRAAAEGSFGVVSLRPGVLLRALAPLDLPNLPRGIVAKVPDDRAFTFEADSDGATLTMTLHLPLDLLASFAALQ